MIVLVVTLTLVGTLMSCIRLDVFKILFKCFVSLSDESSISPFLSSSMIDSLISLSILPINISLSSNERLYRWSVMDVTMKDL